MGYESKATEIRKVLNDGKHLVQQNKIITFITARGKITPHYIYVGFSDRGIEHAQPTKQDCIKAIERYNRMFTQPVRE